MATSAEHGHMSKRRLLVIVLTSTTTFMVANTEFSSSDSCKGLARFKAMKVWPWPSDLHDGSKSMVLAYAVLQGATKNFSSSCLLGEGSFGLVYKARLDDGASVAVKWLTGAGQHSHKEFQGEVDLMSRRRHSNLVALLGYAHDGPEPLVVYEFM